jgi:6-pyruvoyltetrahydropterin/6-carboxytetrahydropterin synthase
MKWQIAKEFSFCYGHRIWSQTLNKELALDSCLECRHLHGHQGKIVIYLESDRLTKGMVTDFKHLNWFKAFIDDVLDHKFIIDINDPLFNDLLPKITKQDLIEFKEGYKLINLTKLKNEPNYLIEMYEGFVIVDFIPTSENLSAWLLKIVQAKMAKYNIQATKIEYFETPKSKSIVYA